MSAATEFRTTAATPIRWARLSKRQKDAWMSVIDALAQEPGVLTQRDTLALDAILDDATGRPAPHVVRAMEQAIGRALAFLGV